MGEEEDNCLEREECQKGEGRGVPLEMGVTIQNRIFYTNFGDGFSGWKEFLKGEVGWKLIFIRSLGNLTSQSFPCGAVIKDIYWMFW